jgi:hypothetical protein
MARANSPALSVSGPARAAPLWPADTLPIRPSDSITPYLYLPLVMRAYRPPPPPPVYPNDPYYYTYGYQWGLNKVRAPEAWALSTGQGVLIAVLDTGTDYTHPDLSGKVRTDIDRDFVNNDDDAMDDNGHGTHVSGIAAAATNNSRGVAGMGWDASILPLKVMDPQGPGAPPNCIPAIYYAADHGARVINMSLAGTTWDNLCPSDVQAAVDYAYRRGILLVAAAGNWPDIAQSPFPGELCPCAGGGGDHQFRQPCLVLQLRRSRQRGRARRGYLQHPAVRRVRLYGRHLHGHALRGRAGRAGLRPLPPPTPPTRPPRRFWIMPRTWGAPAGTPTTAAGG